MPMTREGRGHRTGRAPTPAARRPMGRDLRIWGKMKPVAGDDRVGEGPVEMRRRPAA